MNTYIGIDNGVTGAIAALFPDNTWAFHPVRVIDCGRDRVLDVQGNQTQLETLIERAGGPQRVVVAFEVSKKNPLFGAKGNFANGRNGEFWRVLLSVSGIPFIATEPRVWQKAILQGIPGNDTKQMAEVYVRQRFPAVDLSSFNASQREAIRDAVGIAVWARSFGR